LSEHTILYIDVASPGGRGDPDMEKWALRMERPLGPVEDMVRCMVRKYDAGSGRVIVPSITG
jgi:hypothetical protein